MYNSVSVALHESIVKWYVYLEERSAVTLHMAYVKLIVRSLTDNQGESGYFRIVIHQINSFLKGC